MTPSVTQVVAPWSDFSRIRPDVLVAAAERGTEVHRLCEMIARGEWFPPPPPEIDGYVESFRRWFDLSVASVICTEERLFDHALGFSGRPDLIVEVEGGNIALVDIKTPVAHQRLWALQLAAYTHLCTINHFPVELVGSLRLNPYGGVPTMQWYEQQAEDLTVFLSALNVWRYINL